MYLFRVILSVLAEQVYDSFFLLFSKLSCLHSNLCNSSFLISRLLTVSFFYLLFFYPAPFLPIYHAATHHAVTHDPSIYVCGTILCPVFFCLLQVESYLSSCPPHLFFLNSTPDPHFKSFQFTSTCICHRRMSTSLQHSLHRTCNYRHHA